MLFFFFTKKFNKNNDGIRKKNAKFSVIPQYEDDLNHGLINNIKGIKKIENSLSNVIFFNFKN